MHATLKNVTKSQPTINQKAVCGKYLFYPDLTGRRKAEGGLRVNGLYKESTSNKPLISVITTTLNQELFIEQAMQSVFDQNYDNIEYIVVDAASNDNTPNIIKQYDSSLDYYISEPDDGLYAGMNKGLSLATGDYIIILNSDDWYSEDCIKTLTETAQNRSLDMVCALAIETDEDGNEISRIPKMPLGHNVRLRMPLRHETMLITNALYNRIGPYDESYKIIADLKLTIKLFEASRAFSQIDEYLMYFRKIGIAHRVTPELVSERKKLIHEQFPFLNDEEVNLLSNDYTGSIPYYSQLVRKYEGCAIFKRSIDAYVAMMENLRTVPKKEMANSSGQKIEKTSNLPQGAEKEISKDQRKEKGMHFSKSARTRILWNNSRITSCGSIESYYSKDSCRVYGDPPFDNNKEDRLKVLTLCTFDSGGAGTGSQRRITALRENGIDAKLVSLVVRSSRSFVGRFEPTLESVDNTDFNKVWKVIHENAILMAKKEAGYCAKEMFTLTAHVVDMRQLKPIIEACDILHFHWIVGMVDYKNLPLILRDKPLAWTLGDMNAFTGGCHYSEGCQGYVDECKRCPQLGGHSNLAHEQWKIKKEAYDQIDMHFICPSEWIAERARKSSLIGDRGIHVIPNAYPTDKIIPIEKRIARIKLGLPRNKKMLLFGAENVLNYRKGAYLLQQAVNAFCEKYDYSEVEAVTFGTGNLKLSIPVHSLGFISGEHSLSLAYSAADVFISPSREDVGPMTPGEALLCGTPVVGFTVGILPEILDHKSTGYLVEEFSPNALAKGIKWALSAIENDTNIRNRCRQSAVLALDPAVSARRHKNLYEMMLKEAVISKEFMPSTIAVVIPTLNAVETIDQTIESVIYQEGNFFIRLHIQDRGSTDGTLDRVQYWRDKIDEHFFECHCSGIIFSYDSSKNSGLYTTLNDAFNLLDIPRESMMGWVYSGDLLPCGALSLCFEAMDQRHELNWIIGNTYYYGETDDKGITKNPASFYPREMIAAGLCDGNHWPLLPKVGAFWRAKIWYAVGGFDTDMKFAGEWDLWRRFADITSPVHYEYPLYISKMQPSRLRNDQMRLRKEISLRSQESTDNISARTVNMENIETLHLQMTGSRYEITKNKHYYNHHFTHLKGAGLKSRVFTSIAPENIIHQSSCINSWIKSGLKVTSLNSEEEIDEVRPHFPDVQFFSAKRDAKHETGLPLVYIDDILEIAWDSEEEIVGFVNSDINIEGLDHQKLAFFADHGLVYGHRIDVNPMSTTFLKPYRFGIDSFFFHKRFVDCFSGQGFVLGRTWWDFLFPFQALIHRLNLFQMEVGPTLHLWHEKKSFEEEAFLRNAVKFCIYLSKILDDLDHIELFQSLEILVNNILNLSDRMEVSRLAHAIPYIFGANSSFTDVQNEDWHLSQFALEPRKMLGSSNVYFDDNWHEHDNREDLEIWSPGLSSINIYTSNVCVCNFTFSIRSIYNEDLLFLNLNGVPLRQIDFQKSYKTIGPIPIKCIKGKNVLIFHSKKDPSFVKDDLRLLSFAVKDASVKFEYESQLIQLNKDISSTNDIFILTPTLNSVTTIDRTIRSIINQAGRFQIHYHIQDMGSTDGTVNKLKTWESILSGNGEGIQCDGVKFTWDSKPKSSLPETVWHRFDSFHMNADNYMAVVGTNHFLIPGTLAAVFRVHEDYPDIEWFGFSECGRDDNNYYILDDVTPATEIIREGLCDGLHWNFIQKEGIFFKKSIWFKSKHALKEFSHAWEWNLFREFARHSEYYHFAAPLGSFPYNEVSDSRETLHKQQNEINKVLSPNLRRAAFNELYSKKERLHANIILMNHSSSTVNVKKDYHLLNSLFDKWLDNIEKASFSL